jgi:hypothetical protein
LQKDRVDLTHLKIYTIDSEDADEVCPVSSRKVSLATCC